MEWKLNIKGLFESEDELHEVIKKHKVCYDVEPYYIAKKGKLIQIGFQISLYGTFSVPGKEATPNSPEYMETETAVMKIAEALSNTCTPIHMCESTTIDTATLTYSHDRKMRPDVTVHIPVFDQENFGRPVDENIKNTLNMAMQLLESAGVRKKSWPDSL